MPKKEILGAIKPIAALRSFDIHQAPITTSDQIWVLDNNGGYQILDDYLLEIQQGLTANVVGVYGSTANSLSGNETDGYYVDKDTVSGQGVKTGDVILANNGNIYLASKISGNQVFVKTPPLASYVSQSQLSDKFNGDAAKNALALNGHKDSYFATADEVGTLRNQINGVGGLYIFDTKSAMQTALKEDTGHSKYHKGDTFLLKESGVPDYWVSGISETANDATGFYELTELEAKVNIDASDISDKIATAKAEAIASAKEETSKQVGALQQGDVATALDLAKTNQSDIAALKAPTAEATPLDASATPTASVASDKDGKLKFSFGIPKGAEGKRGRGVFLASVNILSNTDVKKTDIIDGASIAVGDTVFDNGGDAYTVETVSEDTIHVSSNISGFNLKGPKGDTGERGPRGYQIIGADFVGNDLVFTTDEPNS